MVFITGACVLIVEILAIRILAPYFGNTIFAVSSVISVVLAALSLGYYVGGKLSDTYPRETLFYGIIVVSGASIIFLHLVGALFLPTFGYSLSMVEGPMVSSLLLFFFQSFLLGMLSPFAIKLQTMRQESIGVGSASGVIFFWSTLGSIAGSLSAGFFLIPRLGINTIMIGVGFLLMCLGLIFLFKISIWYKILLVLLLTSFFFYLHRTISLSGPTIQNAVYSQDGLYQRIVIYDGLYSGQGARFLMQDRNPSAAGFLTSDDLVFEYTKYYAAYKIFNPNIQNALMIGGGAYSVPKALLEDAPNVQIDVAEIEPSLFDLARQYFSVPDDTRIHNVVEDGRRLLHDSPKKYDLIFSDAFSSVYSTPSHLTTREFFSLAKSKLSANGVFVANVIGSLSKTPPSLLLSEIKTFKRVFDNSYFFAVRSPHGTDLQNIIFIGYNGTEKIDVASSRVRGNSNPIIAGLSQKEINIGQFDLSLFPLLTDDFSPVEYLTAKEL